MSNDDEMYKYLGLGVVFVLVIYIGVKSFKYQSKITNMIEPFTSNNTTQLENIVKMNRDLYDTHVKNDRTSFENTLILLEEYSQYQILNQLLFINNKIIRKKNESLESNMKEINQYKTLIDTLNSSMKFIDRK